MRCAPLLIVCCLVLSLLIQNTCPFGAAGKSSVMPKCDHCPLMRQCQRAAPAERMAWASDANPSHFPLFLFTTANLDHSIQVDARTTRAPFLTVHYTGAYPAELLKPPPMKVTGLPHIFA